MSFGLRNFKKTSTDQNERLFKQFFVVGDDFFAVKTYLHLKQKFGADKIGFIGNLPENKGDLLPLGPTRFRGEEVHKILSHEFPEASLELEKIPALFYKDGAYKEYGGRAKSEALLGDEIFYTTPKILGGQSLIELPSDEEYLELQKAALKIEIKALERARPTDLLEKTMWVFKGANAVHYECEYAFFGHSPAFFLELYEDKNLLSDSCIEFCESTQNISELILRLKLKKPIADEVNTLLLPLSYTHEWGHFIVEFNRQNDGGQILEAVHFLDKNETTEEDISKKIRLFKRILEKIYPLFLQELDSEYVLLRDKSPCLKIDDELFTKNRSHFENFSFVSVDAPFDMQQVGRGSFEYSMASLSAEARGLIQLKFLLNH